MMRLIPATLLLILVVPVRAQEAQLTRTISVSGTAVVKTAPDMIVWQLHIADYDPILAQAKKRNDAKMERVFALRDELDVEKEDLETGRVNVRKEYHRDEHRNRTTFKHFAISRSVTIRQSDLLRFDEFLHKLVSGSDMDVSFSFETSRILELRGEARLKAVRLAQEKAQAMADVVGAKLGKVITLNEHRGSGRVLPAQSYATNAMTFDRISPPPVDLVSGTSAPGAIDVQISVYAMFELE